jgi:hypothetical protein
MTQDDDARVQIACNFGNQKQFCELWVLMISAA